VVLADLPTDLNTTYARILKQIERQEDVNLAIHTFLWLATAKRVLSLGEVVESLSVTSTSTTLPTKLPILRETELIEICGSLVLHDERTNRFSLSHFSVKVGRVYEVIYFQVLMVYLVGISDLRLDSPECGRLAILYQTSGGRREAGYCDPHLPHLSRFSTRNASRYASSTPRGQAVGVFGRILDRALESPQSGTGTWRPRQ
jgi:hypothetical protein